MSVEDLTDSVVEKRSRPSASGSGSRTSGSSREQLVRGDDRFWVDYRAWLETKGYRLYSSDQVGKKWTREQKVKTGPKRSHRRQRRKELDMVYAERLSDGLSVMLKRVTQSSYSQELKVAKFFSTENVVADVRNHCIPVLDVIQVPTYDEVYVIIMPCLLRYDEPQFVTVGEVVELIRQLLEGIQFMHEHHTSIGSYSIMMDVPTRRSHSYGPRALPSGYCRTTCPPKYFFIDFVLSHRFLLEDGPPLALPAESDYSSSSAPEHKGDNAKRPSDPFPTDIYYLGSLIKEDFLEPYHGLEFFEALIREMRQRNPVHRPNIDQVLIQFERIYLSLATPKLRARIIPRKESSMAGMYNGLVHFLRRVKWALRSTPPIPYVP